MRSFRLSPRWSALAVAAAGTLALGSVVLAPSYAAADGQVYVLQGLPGKVVDVSIDSHSVASGVRTAALVGPFKVAGGRHTVTIRSAGKVLLQRKISVSAQSSSDVVVHLPTEGKAGVTMTAYKNDLSAVPKDKAALTVAHTAAVPPADIRVNGKVLFADIANGQSLSLVVPVATYSVAIVPAGKSKPDYFGPVDLTLQGGALNRVYAIGDPTKKTMNVAIHIISTAPMGSAKPSKVNTGTGGQAVGEQPSVYVNLLR
jgi:hypothetical protein